jgi:hypothetical protein
VGEVPEEGVEVEVELGLDLDARPPFASIGVLRDVVRPSASRYIPAL